MPTETQTLPADALSKLCADGPPRAWSLIVTVFGDTGGALEISAGALQAIIGPLGIKSEAMRVAIHRLKADGWITARRVGRSSAYRLEPARQAETDAASARIYAFDPMDATDWHVQIAAPHSTGVAGGVQIAPRVWLLPGPVRATQNLCLTPGSELPDWVLGNLVPDSLYTAYQRLFDALSEIADMPLSDLALAEVISLRVLIVHEWRRVVLKHPRLPDELYPDGCPVGACRTLVRDLLERLPRPDADMIAALG